MKTSNFRSSALPYKWSMKSLVLMFSLTLLGSCEPDDTSDPLPFSYYCRIVDENSGQDFFKMHSDLYNVDSIRILNDYSSGVDLDVIRRLSQDTVIQLAPVSFKRLFIDYRNGDVDTIEQIVDGSISKNHLKRSDFRFNGKHQFTLDFQADDSLWYKLEHYNNINSKKFNPIIITFSKLTND